MRRITTNLLSGLLFFMLSPVFTFSQGIIEVQAADGPTSTTTLRITDQDLLLKIAGDAARGHPYYTYLWVFGDGTFINGTTDSILAHSYLNAQNTFLVNSPTPGADVTVFLTGNYSGGSKPPKKLVSDPSDIGRSPSNAKGFLPSGDLAIDMAPIPFQPNSVPFTTSPAVRLQLNNEGLLPGDTMAAILTFRQPAKLDPPQPVQGQLFLFYNSQVIKGDPPKSKAVNDRFSNESTAPTAPPAIKSGRSNYLRSLLHFHDTDTLGQFALTPAETNDFNNVLIWNYANLSDANLGNEVRNVFAEMANDTSMQVLFNEASKHGDTLRFLAVMTVLDTLNTNTDQLFSQLPNLPAGEAQYLESVGLTSLLQNNFYLANEGFIPLTGGQFPLASKIIGFQETRTPVVAAHDPNSLEVYGCKCPGSGGKKVVGVISFSNDGGAPTTQLKVVLNVPPQLNMNSLDDISMSPTPAQPEFLQGTKDFNQRTITWQWPGLLNPVMQVGVGHPSTMGEIVFSIQLKEGFDLADMEQLLACITFDNGEEMCTLPVGQSNIITTTGNPQVNAELECEECKAYDPEPAGCACGPLCMLLVAVGLFIFLVVIWFVKKFLS
ncbi:MAG: hypothetical protein R2830_06140 [Saprospiraceae bacterium]